MGKKCKQGESCIWNKYRKFNNAVAECAFRKETLCRATGASAGEGGCRVRKQVECLQVCQLKSSTHRVCPRGKEKRKGGCKANRINIGPQIGDCFPNLCKGKYAALACIEAARSE